MMEEQELALRCARGDNAARRELYVQYGSRILALCRRYVSDPADAEDLKQDAFVKIYRVIGRFRWTRPGSLYAWMSRVTINMAFDSYGKRRRLARQLVDVEEMENVIPDESTREEAASVPPEVLSAMIEALPEGYRTVFKLYCIDGLSHKDIAAYWASRRRVRRPAFPGRGRCFPMPSGSTGGTRKMGLPPTAGLASSARCIARLRCAPLPSPWRSFCPSLL